MLTVSPHQLDNLWNAKKLWKVNNSISIYYIFIEKLDKIKKYVRLENVYT